MKYAPMRNVHIPISMFNFLKVEKVYNINYNY